MKFQMKILSIAVLGLFLSHCKTSTSKVKTSSNDTEDAATLATSKQRLSQEDINVFIDTYYPFELSKADRAGTFKISKNSTPTIKYTSFDSLTG